MDIVRLVSDGGQLRAWTLMTALDEICGHEDPANGRRWQNVDWNRNARRGCRTGLGTLVRLQEFECGLVLLSIELGGAV